MLDTLPLDAELSEGTPIGYGEYADERKPVCIPYKCRVRHGHLIGRAGTGKTSVMEGMILDDVRRGVGLVILDPDGDLCERLLCLLPPDAVERTIYLDVGDPDWVPRWNPFHRISDEDRGWVADDLVNVFKSFVDGWGDRLEHIFRNVFYAILSLPSGTLFDASNLLRPDSSDSRQLIQRILDTIDNESVRRFWKHDFRRYRNDELSPLRNQLSKLLLAGTVSLMLSQPENAFHLGEAMDQKKILLVNLSRIGSQVRGIVGSILVSLFRQETLRRSKIPVAQRRESHLYCDEAQHFLTDSLEDLILEARKYNVGLTLSRQYMRQFDPRKRDALSSMGSTIAFGTDLADAEFLTEDLAGKVTAEDLIAQPDYHAIARIGQHVVRIRTYCPSDIVGTGQRSQIIERSRRLYCKPTAEVAAAIRRHRAELV